MALADTLMQQRRQGAMDEIAQVALELFSRDGFEATSVEAIAERVGCSPRTFYRYFGSKDDVMFHDLPAAIEQLGHSLDEQLRAGVGPWSAVCESVVKFMTQFDSSDPFPTQRLNLWLQEPALRTRYLQYVHQAEAEIVEHLCRHRGTSPETDELAELIAVAAIGATRITMFTHRPVRGWKLTKHLRDSLATLGRGLADAAAGSSP